MQEYRTAKVTLTAGTPAEINLHNAYYDSATYAGATAGATVTRSSTWRALHDRQYLYMSTGGPTADLAVDKANNKTYVRVNGARHSLALSRP